MCIEVIVCNTSVVFSRHSVDAQNMLSGNNNASDIHGRVKLKFIVLCLSTM